MQRRLVDLKEGFCLHKFYGIDVMFKYYCNVIELIYKILTTAYLNNMLLDSCSHLNIRILKLCWRFDTERKKDCAMPLMYSKKLT